MRSLVTGVCGFVGDYLARYLISKGDEVLGTQLPQNNKERSYPTTALNITDSEQCVNVILEFKPDIIYHLAGIAFVPEAENNFDRTLTINVGGVNNLFRVCYHFNLPTRILLVSSAEVYGKVTQADLPLTEASLIRPAHNYSLSKAMAELVTLRYDTVASVIMRPFNHIGPEQDDRFVASSFAHQLAKIATGKTKPELKVGNLDAKRDFSDVRDVVKAYYLAAQKGFGLYNVSSGTSVTIREILDLLLQISKLDVSIKNDPSRMRPSEVPEIRGSFSKIKQELGWEPEHSLEDTLKDIYQYWLEIEQATVAE